MGRLTVPREEFERRCAACLDRAHERGLAGVLVWGRGGGPVDGGADLLYLTDHYSPFPTIPDVAGHWAGRGYGAAILSDRGVTLVVDLPDVTPDDVYATELRCTEDVVAEVLAALADAGLRDGDIGLVGLDVLTARQAWALADGAPGVRFQPAEEIVHELRRIKSPAEQELMRQACQVGHKAMEAVLAAATAGRSEAEAVAAGTAVVVQAGGVPYNAFAETYGPGRAARGRGRLPTYAVSPPLEAGEIFTIDMSGALNGYLFDFSRSRSVGPETPAQRRVHSLARDAVLTVVAGLSPGATVATAVQRGLRYLADAGYVEGHAHFTAFGHGLGLGWENPWLLPDNHTLLEPGMCVAVEKVVAEGTLGASYEEDVLITENGPLVLTADGEGRS